MSSLTKESTVSTPNEEPTISSKKEDSAISASKEEPTISSKKEEPTSSTKNERSGRREMHWFVLFLFAIMQLLNTIFPKNMVWGIILIFALKGMFAQGAAIPNSDIQQERPQMNLTSSFEIKTFEFKIGEVKNEVFFWHGDKLQFHPNLE